MSTLAKVVYSTFLLCAMPLGAVLAQGTHHTRKMVRSYIVP